MELSALKWADPLGAPLASRDWRLFNFGRFASCNWRGRIPGVGLHLPRERCTRSSRRTETWVACESTAVWLTTRHCLHSSLWHAVSSALPFDAEGQRLVTRLVDARALLADRTTAGMRGPVAKNMIIRE